MSAAARRMRRFTSQVMGPSVATIVRDSWSREPVSARRLAIGTWCPSVAMIVRNSWSREAVSAPRLAIGMWSTFGALLLMTGVAKVADSAILVVDPGAGPYTTIQDAIDAAAAGDTIEIAPGTYAEELFITEKDLTLRGSGSAEETILDGEGVRRLLLCRESRTKIQSLTFFNAHSDYGAAVYSVGGSLIVEDCRFLDNRATFFDSDVELNLGGAVYCTAPLEACSISGSLFLNNRTREGAKGGGGAIAFTVTPGSGAPFAHLYRSAASSAGSELSVIGCTFLGGVAGQGTSVYAGRDLSLRVERCLLLDDTAPDNLIRQDRSDALSEASCCLVWRYGLMGARSGLPAPRRGTILFEDPRRCPDDTLSLHESSPAFAQFACAPIGNLPARCNEPIIVAVRPEVVRPETDQVLEVYGYGVEDVDEVVLIDELGVETATASPARPAGSLWLAARFDLSGARSGPRDLVLRRGGKEIARKEAATRVETVTIFGFVDGWVTDPTQKERRALVGRSLHGQLEIELRHDPSGEAIAVQLEETSHTDTLVALFDASGAPAGIYDLRFHQAGEKEQVLRSALYLGDPPVLEVPGDHDSVQDAIDSAPPGAHVVLASREFLETIVIDRPIVLRGDPNDPPRLNGRDLRTRIVTVLPQAGPLVRMRGVEFTHGYLSEGDGGGIWSAGMVELDSCVVAHSQVRNGNGGGAALGPGSRVLGTRIMFNRTDSEVADPDAWPLWSRSNRGLGGGLYALDCRVEESVFAGNTSAAGGGLVVRGTIDRCTLANNYSEDRSIPALAANAFIVQGAFIGNTVSKECGGWVSHGLVEGPSLIAYNTFTDYLDPLLCSNDVLTSIYVRGPAEVHHNSLAGVGFVFCPFHRLGPDGPGLEVRANLVPRLPSWEPPSGDWCVLAPDAGAVFEIPPDQIDVHCNIGTAVQLLSSEDVLAGCDDCLIDLDPLYCDLIVDEVVDHSFDLRVEKESPAIPENNPFACPDTLGALGVGCGVVPIYVLSSEIRRLPSGAVELRWRTNPDLDLMGFEVDRVWDGRTEPATTGPLGPCTDCVFVDEGAPAGEPVWYELVMLLTPDESLRIPLGSAQPSGLTHRLEIMKVQPNPARSPVQVSFTTDRAADWTLDLIDAAGRVSATLSHGARPAGWHEETLFLPAQLPSGVYWLRVSDQRSTAVSKLVLLE